MKKKWLLAAVCALALVLTACAGVPKETTQAPAGTTAPAEPPAPTEPSGPIAETNLLYQNKTPDVIPTNVYRSNYRCDQIRSVTFLDTLENAGEEAWDVSDAENGAVLAWVEADGEMYDLYIGAEGGVWAGESCRNMFSAYTRVEQICFGDAFHTENVRDMSGMFLWCKSLRELDLSGIDTSRVTDMTDMFAVCHALEMVDLNSFDTARVELMGGMFEHCTSLLVLELGNFNTANVTNMAGMFAHCESLTRLDLSSFRTPNLTLMVYMFDGCRSLTELDVSGFDTSSVTSMGYLFRNCDSLTELDLSHFDMSSVSGDYCTHKMFENCPAGSEWKHLQK